MELSLDRLRSLLQKFYNDPGIPEAREALRRWLLAVGRDSARERMLALGPSLSSADGPLDSGQIAELVRQVLALDRQRPVAVAKTRSPATPLYRFSLVAGAAIAVLLIFSIIYIRKHFDPSLPATAGGNTVDLTLSPVRNDEAKLYLPSGRSIDLDSAKAGLLAQVGGLQLRKQGKGLLVITRSGAQSMPEDPVGKAVQTLCTAAGSQYQITLPDGTNVWLNADSRLVVPTAFGRTPRRVALSGEGYFEVGQEGQGPFVVDVQNDSGAVVGELWGQGSHFNVMAYTDEPDVLVTLLSGQLKVGNQTPAARARPVGDRKGLSLLAGQAARMDWRGASARVQADPLDAVIAWKNGRFAFGGVGIGVVMRQLSRWYDITVRYRDTVSAQFTGTISRHAALPELLKMLELSGKVHFSVHGDTVIASR